LISSAVDYARTGAQLSAGRTFAEGGGGGGRAVAGERFLMFFMFAVVYRMSNEKMLNVVQMLVRSWICIGL
jgi:hypothetical protein